MGNKLKISLERLNYWGERISGFAHLCYAICIEPKSSDDDSKRHEFILNFILSAVILMLSMLDVSILVNSIRLGKDYENISFAVATGVVSLFVFLLYLSRKGKTLWASYSLLAMLYLATTYSVYKWGVGMPLNLLGYAFIIIIASILISNLWGFISSLIVATTILALGYRDSISGVLPAWKQSLVQMPDIIQYVIVLLLITALSWLSSREIDKSLKRARKSEADLTKERDSLEVKIEERTQELRIAQIEKISQLYRFAELGKISSGLFHDLANPLTTLVLNVNKAKTTSDLSDPALTQHLDSAVRSTRKIEDLMTSIKKQIQNQDISVEFCLNDEAEQVLDLLDHRAREANVSLRFSADKRVVLTGNPMKFDQIVLNLVSNAIDAYEPLARSVSRSREVVIELKLEIAGILLIVTDNGIGINKDVLPRIFDPLFTTKSSDSGTGLGLSITKTILEKDFGGDISVSSVIGQGSVFTAKIPLNEKSRKHFSANKKAGKKSA